MQDGATQQEYCEIGQDGGMAGIEMWCVRTTIDIGSDNTVEIAPSDDDSEGDATLICACLWISPCNRSSRFFLKRSNETTFHVITCPGDGVGNAWIYAHCAKEDSRISNPSGFST